MAADSMVEVVSAAVVVLGADIPAEAAVSAEAEAWRVLAQARFSFGARPVYGRPVYARPASSGSLSSSTRATTAFNRQPNRITSNGNRTTSNGARTAQTSRPSAARTTDRRPDIASNHIYARHDGSWHHDWDHRGAHFSNGHWWCYDGAAWIGLDAGYYPWDYYPYYAYDYYPYDYYPGYYADVEPEYYNAGVSSSVDQTRTLMSPPFRPI